MGRIVRRFRSPVAIAIVVALVVGGTTAVAAPTAVTSVVKFAKRAKLANRAKRANFAKSASRARRAKLANISNFSNDSGRLQGHPASDFASGPSNRKIDFRAQAGTGETPLLDTGKFLLSASCDSGGHLRILATTRVDHADIESLGNGGDTQLDDFSIGDSPRNLGPTQGEHRSVIYTERGGQTVDVEYLAASENYPTPRQGDPNPDHGSPLGGAVDCLVTGYAIVQ